MNTDITIVAALAATGWWYAFIVEKLAGWRGALWTAIIASLMTLGFVGHLVGWLSGAPA